MKEIQLSYKSIIYYEIISDNGIMYTMDKQEFYNSKQEIKYIIDNAIV